MINHHLHKDRNSLIKLITISSEEAGQRIDNFLRIRLKTIPKSMMYRLLRKGFIRINKKILKPKYKLLTGDEVSIPMIYILDQRKKPIFPCPKKISALNKIILYEDEYILVLNKPSGIAVHAGSGLHFGIIEELRSIRPKNTFLELVHRLDRDTSGVLLLAKKRSVLCFLHEQFCMKKIQKEYLALVRGQWNKSIKSVQVPLLKIVKNKEHIMQVNQAGKISETHFKIEERYKFATLVRCLPITGRTHQIRVHTQYLGHPIAFDDRYGDRKFNKRLLNAGTGLQRLFLHAMTLKFNHPNTKKKICFEAPLDKQLKRTLEILRANFS